MLWFTHIAFGLLFGLLFLTFSEGFTTTFLLLVMVGSVLPDIDESGSKVNQYISITRLIGWLFKHRGFFHSLFPVFAMYAFFFSIGLKWVGTALSLGYMSHLIADGMTYQGVNLFHPFVRVKGFMKTGGVVEYLLFFVVIVLDVLLLL